MSIPREGDCFETVEQLIQCPFGTRIEETEGYWLKMADGMWGYESEDDEPEDWETRTSQEMRPAGCTLVFSPPNYGDETVERYRFRYLDTIRWGQERNGIAVHVLNSFVTDVGLSDLDGSVVEWAPGMVLRSNWNTNRLPSESLVHAGDPNEWGRFGLFVKRDGIWRHVLGERSSVDRQPVTVDQVAGSKVVPDWWTQVPTAEDEAAIKVFKKRAYQVGMTYKSNQGWCSTYEDVVLQAGIDWSVTR
jgi:hypothetical protein